VLSVLLWFAVLYYLFAILWPLCCLSYYDSRFHITSLVSFGHCVVCPNTIHAFVLPLWYIVAIVLSVLLRFTVSYYLFGILWPFCFLPYCDSRFVLRLWYLVAIVLSVLLRFTFCITSLVSCGHCVVCPITIHVLFYLFGILWPLCCLSYYDSRFRITSLVSSSLSWMYVVNWFSMQFWCIIN
jgi:fumarate reductase subunit D